MARIEIADVDARARSIEAHDLIEEAAAVGEKLRPGDRNVARGLIELGDERGLRARSADRVQPLRPVREQDRVVGCPSAAGGA